MATSCATCGAKLGFGRRLTGKAFCEACEKQEQARRQEEDRRRAEARAEYVALAATGGNDEGMAPRLAALAERAAFSPADRRAAGMAALTTLIERVVEDELLGEEDERDMMALMNRLDLTAEDFRATLEPFGNRVAIARMAAGRLHDITDPVIVLKPKEKAHLQVEANLMKEVVHRETRGGYSGVSIPIAKGVRFRTGSYRGRSVVVGTSLEVADQGVLCITSHRAVFKGMRQSAEFSFAKLLGVNVFDDGIQFHVSNRKTAPLFHVADGYFVAAAVNAVVQREV